MANFLEESLGALQDRFLGQGNIKRANRELDIREREVDLRRSERDALRTSREREFYAKFTEQLTEAMLEPDPAIRQTAVDSLLQSAEAMRGKPISKNFRSWIVKQPDQALQVLTGIQERGVDPKIFLQVGDDPMLFAHGLLALGRANRERQARGLRGDGGGDAQATPGAPTSQAPGGKGLELGGVKQENPFGAQGEAAMPTTQSTGQPQDEYTQGLQMQVTALERRISGLAGLGRPETEIAPLRQELTELRKELRAPISTQRTEGARLSVQPVTTEDIQRGVAAAQRAGRPELAQRFVPGMRREAYDALLQKLGSTQTEATTPNAPTATASPISAPATPGALAARPVQSLVPTKEEELRTQKKIEREEQPLPTDLRRDPSLRGVNTVGQLEASGKQPSTAAQLSRSETLASEGAKATVADFETVKRDGMAARQQQRYLDVLAGAAEKAGPRGPWLTPMRESLNNFANLLGVADPWGQSKLQLISSVTPKLAVVISQQFKGSQSDREFMAALSTAPSILNTEKGFAVMVYVAREANKLTVAHDLAARQWVARNGALDTPNQRGKSFQEDWDEALINFERTDGTLQERVSNALGLRVSELLKAR